MLMLSSVRRFSKLINIGHGDPTFFRSWWKKHEVLPSIPTNKRYLYEYQEGELDELSDLTHRFHQLFGTDIEKSSIVYGNGSTQVINAILYGIAKKLNRPIVVGYKPPVYMLMHEYLTNSKWVEVTFDLSRENIDVEIVIDPNNPTGDHRKKISEAPYTIYDKAYNWPIYVSEVTKTSTNKNDITVFTISKCMGMGGLRLGWAFINNQDLLEEIKRSLIVIGICPNSFSVEAIKCILYRFISDPKIKENYAQENYEIIQKRRKLLENNEYFSVVNNSGPYAWIKARENLDISVFLYQKYNILVYSGVQFASDKTHARLSLICCEDEFMEAVNRLKTPHDIKNGLHKRKQ